MSISNALDVSHGCMASHPPPVEDLGSFFCRSHGARSCVKTSSSSLPVVNFVTTAPLIWSKFSAPPVVRIKRAKAQHRDLVGCRIYDVDFYPSSRGSVTIIIPPARDDFNDVFVFFKIFSDFSRPSSSSSSSSSRPVPIFRNARNAPSSFSSLFGTYRHSVARILIPSSTHAAARDFKNRSSAYAFAALEYSSRYLRRGGRYLLFFTRFPPFLAFLFPRAKGFSPPPLVSSSSSSSSFLSSLSRGGVLCALFESSQASALVARRAIVSSLSLSRLALFPTSLSAVFPFACGGFQGRE